MVDMPSSCAVIVPSHTWLKMNFKPGPEPFQVATYKFYSPVAIFGFNRLFYPLPQA